MRSLKTAVSASSQTTHETLQAGMAGLFFLKYRNAAHAIANTKKPPALLFKDRLLRSSMALNTSDVCFFRGNNSQLCEGLVLSRLGNRMFSIVDKEDETVHRRDNDQITPSTPHRQPISSPICRSLFKARPNKICQN